MVFFFFLKSVFVGISLPELTLKNYLIMSFLMSPKGPALLLFSPFAKNEKTT